jgi:hydrogenase nickel incorporation protein HypA/HybF
MTRVHRGAWSAKVLNPELSIMHEMALCQGLMELIGDQRQQHPFDRVLRVVVEVGVLGHVDPHALEFAFEVHAKGSAAADAVLEIREMPARAWCMDCSESIAIDRRGDACPGCGGYTLIVEQGEEMRLKELEVV